MSSGKGIVIGMSMIAVSMLCIGCNQKEEIVEEAEVTERAEESSETVEEERISPEAEEIVSAIKKASEESDFQINMDMQLKLNGNLIQLEMNTNSIIDISQGEAPEDLQMSMQTTSDLDDIVSKAHYQDGWYYTDDKNGENKVEKSPQEVMDTVTEITSLVTDAAGDIKIISVEEENSEKIYTYTLPTYIAEKYLKELIRTAATEEKALKGAKARVETLKMVSTVDADGILSKQELYIAGNVKKSLFKLPAEGNISAEYERK